MKIDIDVKELARILNDKGYKANFKFIEDIIQDRILEGLVLDSAIDSVIEEMDNIEQKGE